MTKRRAPGRPGALAEPIGGSWAPGSTIVGDLVARWGEAPAASALWGAGASRWMTAGELERASAAAASSLRRLGLGPGGRCLWSAAATAASLAAALGVLRLGAVLVPVNPAWTGRELSHVVADVEPDAAVVERADQRAVVAAGAPSAGVAAAEVLGGDRPAGPAGPAGVTLDTAGPHEPALIVFTSGTTGAPKGAVLTQANLAAGAASLRAAWDWVPQDRLVSALPLFHVHGLCVGFLGSLAAGTSVVQLERFEAGDVLDAAVAHRASLFFGVPTMFHRLAASGRAAELARLRLCVSGSAALSADLWGRLHDEAGVDVLERYGCTETLLTVSNPLMGERRPGMIGRPLPGADIRIGPDGELWVRGPSVFIGYWRQPEATAAVLDGGWFATGDLVREEADGYLRVLGRRTEVIITGGFNVYPAEVEAVLGGHPGVAEVAVGALASAEWGEIVCAWVVAAPGGVDEASVLELAASQLAPYKRPRQVRVVEALPRNAMGKVVRSRLA